MGAGGRWRALVAQAPMQQSGEAGLHSGMTLMVCIEPPPVDQGFLDKPRSSLHGGLGARGDQRGLLRGLCAWVVATPVDGTWGPLFTAASPPARRYCDVRRGVVAAASKRTCRASRQMSQRLYDAQIACQLQCGAISRQLQIDITAFRGCNCSVRVLQLLFRRVLPFCNDELSVYLYSPE